MKIERVEVRVVAPKAQRFTWSHDLPEQYMTNTVVRIFTDDGIEGAAGVSNYTSYDFDRYTAETMRHMIPALIGRDPLQREAIWSSLYGSFHYHQVRWLLLTLHCGIYLAGKEICQSTNYWEVLPTACCHMQARLFLKILPLI